ncbi:hypothetical protein TNCV_4986091 [Trichonephila clavipes]|nr:hypothetical protein TNCV_4986091 [Trichonephila clavipes]
MVNATEIWARLRIEGKTFVGWGKLSFNPLQKETCNAKYTGVAASELISPLFARKDNKIQSRVDLASRIPNRRTPSGSSFYGGCWLYAVPTHHKILQKTPLVFTITIRPTREERVGNNSETAETVGVTNHFRKMILTVRVIIGSCSGAHKEGGVQTPPKPLISFPIDYNSTYIVRKI